MRIAQRFAIHYYYDILFTQFVFSPANPVLHDVLTSKINKDMVKVAFVVDQGLYQCQPDLINAIQAYCTAYRAIKLATVPLLVSGGEQVKNDREMFEKTLQMINDVKIDRHAFIVAVGGGAVLDMVGFAAAIGHRGIRHIRVPSTVLAQNDSGIGVKNGINYFGKKNFLGTFSSPYAVINDLTFLNTLENRDWRAGISEALKVALIKDSSFFEWLEANVDALVSRELHPMEKLIFECARLHADHIVGGNDPFEMDSSRPLDFGHWSAHKLEQLTRFNLRHGEAVAVGIALDVAYAVHAGYLESKIADRILALIQKLKLDFFHPQLLDVQGVNINPSLIEGLEEFREHLGGELTITLINDIGISFNVHEMNYALIEQAALTLQQRHAN